MNATNATPRPDRERGSVSVEFALMLVFFLLPLLAGIVDFGQILHAQTVITRAAREGAVAAARSRSITAAVNTYIQNAGYNLGYSSVSTTGPLVAGQPVAVTVTYNTNAMVIIPWGKISPNLTQLVATATTQRF